MKLYLKWNFTINVLRWFLFYKFLSYDLKLFCSEGLPRDSRDSRYMIYIYIIIKGSNNILFTVFFGVLEYTALLLLLLPYYPEIQCHNHILLKLSKIKMHLSIYLFLNTLNSNWRLEIKLSNNLLFHPLLLLWLINQTKWFIFCIRDPVILDHKIITSFSERLIVLGAIN